MVPTPDAYNDIVEGKKEMYAEQMLRMISESLEAGSYEGNVDPRKVMKGGDVGNLVLLEAWSMTVDTLKKLGYKGQFNVSRRDNKFMWRIYLAEECETMSMVKRGAVKLMKWTAIGMISMVAAMYCNIIVLEMNNED